MLVVKSLLRGEFAASASKKPKQQSNNAVSTTDGDSEVTTIASDTHRDDDDDDFSCGSHLAGDSFVLDVDWTESADSNNHYYHPQQAGHNTNMNESMEDPYLAAKESVRRRLCSGTHTKEEEGTENAISTSTRHAGVQQPAAAVARGTSPTSTAQPFDCQASPVAATGQRTPGKSLGTFQFPVSRSNRKNTSFPSASFDADEWTTDCDDDDDDDDTEEDEDDDDSQRPSRAVTVPALPNLDPLHISSVQHDDDSSSSDASLNQSSNTLPTTPLHLNNINSTDNLTRHQRNREVRHAARTRAQELKERLSQRQQNHSSRPLPTAQLYLQLGLAQQQAHDFPAAISSFFQSAALYRHFHKPVALATVLDHAAVSYLQAKEQGGASAIHRYHKVERFHQCLDEALVLRKEHLGAWHVDTVHTLQNLAKLLLLTGHAARAAVLYVEVVHLRRAILGPHHPSTAVSAHCLGNAYVQCHDTVAAELWYDTALQIYNHMQLPNDNPAVHKLLKDRKQLERVERWMEHNNEDDGEHLVFEIM